MVSINECDITYRKKKDTAELIPNKFACSIISLAQMQNTILVNLPHLNIPAALLKHAIDILNSSKPIMLLIFNHRIPF